MTSIGIPKPSRRVDRKLLDEVAAKSCLVCLAPSDPAHIRGKGAGGPDEPWNLLNLCRSCHQRQHRKGWKYMAQAFPEVAKALTARGWEISDDGKMWNEKLRRDV